MIDLSLQGESEERVLEGFLAKIRKRKDGEVKKTLSQH